MTRRALVEGIILSGIGVGGIVEGVRLIRDRDAITVPEMVGPDIYVLLLGIALLATGLFYIRASSGQRARGTSPSWSLPRIDPKLAVTFLITAGYVYAIGTLGYFVSSLLFLVAAFRCAGVESWRTTLLLSAGIASGYYILFVRYCEVIFPTGMLF